MNNIWTVYQHIFPNNVYYIGITSQDPLLRWNNGLGYKGQKIYELIQKYDWNVEIQHQILYTNLTQEEASTIEKYLISAWRSIDENKIAYNIASGGTEIIMKKVYQYDINGNYLNTFNSVAAAAEATGDKNSISNIRNCCYGNRQTANGYRWSYEKIELLPKIKIKNNIEKAKPFKIDQYTLDNKFIQSFHTIIEAETITGVERNAISRCTLNKQKTAGGYKWTKHKIPINDERRQILHVPVLQYDLNNNYIQTFDSVAKANYAMTNTNHGHVGEACRGLLKTAYGYIWKYQQIFDKG